MKSTTIKKTCIFAIVILMLIGCASNTPTIKEEITKAKVDDLEQIAIRDSLFQVNYKDSVNFDVLFYDDFNDNDNNWESNFCKIQDGKLTLVSKLKDEGQRVYKDVNIGGWNGFVIETAIAQDIGMPKDGYGIIIQTENGVSYHFLISAIGASKIQKSFQDKKVDLSDWKWISEFNFDNQYNNLRVEKQDRFVYFFVNGERVNFFENDIENVTQIGFYTSNTQLISSAFQKISVIRENELERLINKTTFKPVFSEPFVNNNLDWAVSDSVSESISEIIYGKYYLREKRENGLLAVQNQLNFDNSKDFYIETAIEAIEGDTQKTYGIIFDKKDAENFSHLEISRDGRYKISQFINGKIVTENKWKGTTGLNVANAAWNEFVFVKSGENLKIFANNSFVTEIKLGNDFGTQFGFFALGEQYIAVNYLNVFEKK